MSGRAHREGLLHGAYPLVVVNVACGGFDSLSLTKFMRAMMGASRVHMEAPLEVENVPPIEAFTPNTEIDLVVTDYRWHASRQQGT